MASAPLTHSLPEDIVVDILARLPVKSLKRFRCVGKSWCSLIQSPQFISAHYTFSKHKVYPIVKHWKHEGQTEGKNVLSIISNQTLEIVANLDIPSFTDEESSLVIQGYCNGIICLCYYKSDGLCYYKSDVLLWNIATKEIKTLPICPVESPPGFFNHDVVVVCMGYDCKRDDYKVIRIDEFWNDDDELDYEDPRSKPCKRVALYSLSTDSWRKFDANLTVVEPEFSDYYFEGSQFYSNGFVHCEGSIGNERFLLSFDMSSELFVTTPLPDDTKKDSYFNLVEINGSVGGICELWRRDPNCYDVWVLSEVGVKHSWIKLFTVGPILPFELRPLGVGSNGKVFFSELDPGNLLVWHHPSNRQIKIVQIQGICLELAMYAESLVSLRGGGSAFNN